MTVLKFHFLGPPRFTLNGSPIRMRRRKAVALAAYLVVTGRPHSREHLADLFWPECDAKKSRASLRRTLSVMTKALGKFWLAINTDTIGFVPHEDLWVDVIVFARCIAQSAGGDDTMAVWKEAAGLYQNHFMAGFGIGGTPDFEDWQFDQKESFCRGAIRVRELLADLCTARMDFSGAVTHAGGRVALDPLNESAHRQLIRAYRDTGQRGRALRQYDRCKDLIQKELGVAPEEKTTCLGTEIKTFSHDVSPPFSPEMMNLPEQSPPFVGRKKERHAVIRLMTDPKVRLLTLTGPGGIGKTRLALETASDLSRQFFQGVFFIPLSGVFSPESMAASLVRTFRLSSDGKSDPLKQAINFIGTRKILLILDNFEHLIREGLPVTDLLEQAPGLKIMTTSRARLMLTKEHVFPLSGLAGPGAPAQTENGNDGLTIKETAVEETCDAVALFLSTARRISPRLTLTAQNFAGIARICELTEGMPLAIILAAGWSDVFSPDKIADKILGRLDFLKAAVQDFPACHRSIHAVFDTSWNRLPENEKTLFLKLTVFKDGFTPDALKAVTEVQHDAAVLLAASLVRKSMIKADPGTGRFDIHPLLRQYGRERLARSGLLEKMKDAHKAYYLNMARDSETRLIGEQMLVCRGELDADFDNICQAWHRAVTQKDLLSLVQSATGLYVYFDMHTRYHEGEAFFRPAKELIMGVSGKKPDPDLDLEIILLCWLDMYISGASSLHGVRGIEKTARLWVIKSKTRTRAKIFLLLGALAHARSHYTRAIRFYRLGLKADPAIEKPFWVTVRMGTCYRALKDMDKAVMTFSRSHEIGVGFNDAIKTAWSLGNLGSAHLCMGDLETAGGFLEKAEQLFKKIGAPLGIKATLEELALISFFKGELTRAVCLTDQVLALSNLPGFAPGGYSRACALKGLSLVATKDSEQGSIFLEKVLKTGGSCFTAHLGMVFLACLKENTSLAQHHLKLAETYKDSISKTPLIPLLHLACASVYEQTGQDEKAWASLSALFHHPCCPTGLLNSWTLAQDLLSRLESGMLPEKFKKINTIHPTKTGCILTKKTL